MCKAFAHSKKKLLSFTSQKACNRISCSATQKKKRISCSASTATMLCYLYLTLLGYCRECYCKWNWNSSLEREKKAQLCQSDSQKYGICFSSIPFCNLVWFGGHQENRPRIVSTKFQQSNQKYSPLRTVYVNQRNRLPLVANGVKPTEHLCAAWRIPCHHPPRLCGTLHFAQAGKRALWFMPYRGLLTFS